MTDSEIAECKRLADLHIAKKGTTNATYIANIQNQAIRERWDLGQNKSKSPPPPKSEFSEPLSQDNPKFKGMKND